MSAWEVYLFMQIESIALGLLLVSFSLALYAGARHLTYYADYVDVRTKPSLKVAGVALVMFSIAFLLPSQKTIAAMYLLPKLTSDEVAEPLTAEAKEIYGLLKDALKKMSEAE